MQVRRTKNGGPGSAGNNTSKPSNESRDWSKTRLRRGRPNERLIESSQAPADHPEPVTYADSAELQYGRGRSRRVEKVLFLLKKAKAAWINADANTKQAKHANIGILNCIILVFICRISNS